MQWKNSIRAWRSRLLKRQSLFRRSERATSPNRWPWRHAVDHAARGIVASSADELRQEIKRITGVEVREAATEVETTTGTVVQVFTTGTMVQVFLLAQGVPAGSWSGNGSGKRSLPRHQQGTGSPGTGSALILCLTTEPGFRVGRPGLSVHRSHMWERINPSASHQAWSEIMLRFGMQIAGVVRNSPTKPIFYWRVYHVTVRNRLPRHRFDRCVPRLWRNRRFLRGSGANPLRRLPHYRAALVRGRRVQKGRVLDVTGAYVSSATLGGTLRNPRQGRLDIPASGSGASA